ncbi:hypothetical protein [Pacificoceanicola onchidii]|uniref:hypothetical protein n=1 Tax=Pacificoceanicola onchidii TaxID=2562685 RepID=UPI0010A2BA95|nr:hypothetical protein [Pacificoceanicola onchidii]
MLHLRLWSTAALLACLGAAGTAAPRDVILLTGSGEETRIATVEIAEDGRYSVTMAEAPFSDHFLSMRPFRCIAGPDKHWCHLPYPYEIRRDISKDLTDLEYDFLFVWKGANDYGINLWNGVYYRLEEQAGTLVGTLHEVDLDQLGVPPEAGNLRPLRDKDLHQSDPESHWLPQLVIR